MEEAHVAKLEAFTDELGDLESSRPTTFEIIDRAGYERYWQEMLAYFLDPTRSHGLGTTVLEAFLEAIAEDVGTNSSDLTDHLDTVSVDREVSVPPNRNVDLLLWAQGEWFICIELKVDAGETDNQTEQYTEGPSLGRLVKKRHEDRGGKSYYVYLAPEDASPPNADAFAEVSWRDVVSTLEDQVIDGQETSQSRAQLNDFLQTIKKYLTMAEFSTITEEARLYAQNKDMIKQIKEEYTDELGRLKDTMEDVLKAEFQGDEWQTRQLTSTYRWVQLYKEGWREDIRFEYEPKFRLGEEPPVIELRFDIEGGSGQKRKNSRDLLEDRLEKSVLEDLGWTITGNEAPCLLKPFQLNVESPRRTIEETVQAIREFHSEQGHHIDATVAEYNHD